MEWIKWNDKYNKDTETEAWRVLFLLFSDRRIRRIFKYALQILIV
jgi:hypothetical protein